MRQILIVFVCLSLVACGAIPPSMTEGRNVSTEHEAGRFKDAVAGATEYCSRQNMSVRHLSTAGTGMFTAVSRFECVPR